MRPAVLCALLALAAACGHPSYPQAVAHPLLGRPLPVIHRRTTDGQPIDLAALAGKPVLVKFFADYCPPCRETLAAAEHVHQTHPEVAFVGIDEDESSDTASSLVRRYGLTFPVVHDAGNFLSARFHVHTIPMTFVADATGVVRWVGAEGQTEDDLEKAVEAAR
jgi:thiol-disulfide isomerase/thioredoxin